MIMDRLQETTVRYEVGLFSGETCDAYAEGHRAHPLMWQFPRLHLLSFPQLDNNTTRLRVGGRVAIVQTNGQPQGYHY